MALRDRFVHMLRRLCASYGGSIAVHAALLGALALITIALPDRDGEAVIVVRHAAPAPSATPRLSHDTVAPRDDAPEAEPLEPVFEIAEEAPAAPSLPAPQAAALPTTPELTSLRARDLGLGAPAAGGAYAARVHKRSLRREGGSAETEAAVRSALSWLARHQGDDGGWRVDGWSEHCDDESCVAAGRNRTWQTYGEDHDVGVTALALLACLGNGHTATQGTFKRVVRRGLQFLTRQQREDGSIGYQHGMLHTVYDHALATFALCEAYAISRDFTLRRPAQRALDWAVAAQNPGAGWRYGIQPGESDTSVTGWFGLALAAGRKAKLQVPETAFSGIRSWFDEVTTSTGDAGYSAPGNGSVVFAPNHGRFDDLPVNTAVVAACRQLLPRTRTRSLTPLLDRIARHPPQWEDTQRNYYYWYYGTYALFQAGGQRWRRWNLAMQDALLPHQRDAGCARGSWDAIGEWCLVGGRVYATALNALTLEIYYRYRRGA